MSVATTTIDGNSALGNGGGGIFNNGGGIFGDTSVMLKNTIVAENTASAGQDVMGMLTSNAYNLIGDDDQSDFPNTESSDILGGNPMLGTLADNGGDTQTIPLMSGSPAIDVGDSADTFNDQRNYMLNGTRDIGAYEFGGMVSAENSSMEIVSSVYPNPSNGIINININESIVGDIKLRLVNISGRLILEREVNIGQNQLNLSQYANGLYLLSVQTNNSVNTFKLVLE